MQRIGQIICYQPIEGILAMLLARHHSNVFQDREVPRDRRFQHFGAYADRPGVQFRRSSLPTMSGSDTRLGAWLRSLLSRLHPTRWRLGFA
jgi:hypothetical protein